MLRRKKWGQYLEQHNIFFCGGEGKEKNVWRRDIYFFVAEKKEKEEIVWKRKINGDTGQPIS